jgi:hypothetical protein
MWRLIKAELGYLRYFIYGISLLILVHGFAAPVNFPYYIKGGPTGFYSPIESLKDGIQYLLPFHIIIIFILLYLYIREYRLRQYVVIPVRKAQIITARLATPIVLAVFFILLSLLPVMINGLIFSRVWITQFFHFVTQSDSFSGQASAQERYNLYHNYIEYGFNKPMAIFSYTVQLIVFFTYAFWLFSERFGWYLLGAYFAFAVYQNGILPIFNPKLAWAITDLIQYSVFTPRYGWYVDVFISLGFAVLIAISFYTRRSFMR